MKNDEHFCTLILSLEMHSFRLSCSPPPPPPNRKFPNEIIEPHLVIDYFMALKRWKKLECSVSHLGIVGYIHAHYYVSGQKDMHTDCDSSNIDIRERSTFNVPSMVNRLDMRGFQFENQFKTTSNWNEVEIDMGLVNRNPNWINEFNKSTRSIFNKNKQNRSSIIIVGDKMASFEILINPVSNHWVAH